MTSPTFIPLLSAGLMIGALAIPATAATAQQAPADRQDAALAYAQCVRDNGYVEFPDPDPEGGFKFLINPDDVARFKKAADACRDLAPEGMRDDGVTPEQLDALIRLSQCVRENGVPEFPDPDARGGHDLSNTGIKPGDPRLEAALAACRDESGQGMRITIGG